MIFIMGFLGCLEMNLGSFVIGVGSFGVVLEVMMCYCCLCERDGVVGVV